MSVSTYNNNSCKYRIDKLDKVVYLISSDAAKNIHIDSGNAYIDEIVEEPLALNVFNLEFADNEELDERYKFSHSLRFSMQGYASYKDFQGRFYAIVKTMDGNYWLVNPLFPCKVTYTYTLDSTGSHTDFTLATVSNHPTLLVDGIDYATPYVCQGYSYCTLKELELNENKYSVKTSSGISYTNDGFKHVVFNKNSASLQEQFDGENVQHIINFSIKFDDYKSSWHYNLLEFMDNTYAAIIKTSCNKCIYTGFNFGLQPSFTVNCNDSDTSVINIQLIDKHDTGSLVDFEDIEEPEYDDNFTYVYTSEHNGYECVGNGVAKYLLKKELDAFGNPTNRYMCLEGYESQFSDLNIIGTFSTTEEFSNNMCVSPRCFLDTSIPDEIIFERITRNEYTLFATSDWTITSSAQHISVFPSSGRTGTMTNVVIGNEMDPVSAITSQLTISYCDKTKVVNVISRPKSSCFYSGSTYNISANGQTLIIPTTCCVSAATESSHTISSISFVKNRLEVYVPENLSESARTFTLAVLLCDSSITQLTINQGTVFNKWVKEGTTCAGNQKCDVERMYIGTSPHSITASTQTTRTVNCVTSSDCGGGITLYKWVDVAGEYTCEDMDKYQVTQKYVSFDNGHNYSAVTPAEYSVGALLESDSYYCRTGVYLTFVATESGTFKFSGNSVSYSLDNGSTWTTLSSNTDSPTVAAGSKIMWKAELTPSSNGIGTFSSTGSFTVEGNPMSLLYGDNFIGRTSLSGKDYAFCNLFSGCTNLTSAENMILPATTLSEDCYLGMFQGCTSLTNVPELPATTLVGDCYSRMFYGCTSLTTAPELPATTLHIGCYAEMFSGCTSLTTAPVLSATTLAASCYNGMFADCTSLTEAPALPATTLAEGCYKSMFARTSLEEAPELPAMTLEVNCYAGMFAMTPLTTAPVLSAATLDSACYNQMFAGCRNLNYIKCLATDISASGCTSNWVNGVASSGTFVRDSNMYDWSIGNDGIPTNWVIEPPIIREGYLTFVATESGTFKFSGNSVSYSLDSGTTWTSLASNTDSPTVEAGSKIMWKAELTPQINIGIGIFSSTGAFTVEGNPMSLLFGYNFGDKTSLSGKSFAFCNLFSGCTNLTSAENMVLPATTLAASCYSHMFEGCTSLTTAPELPATTLASGCYASMFRNCTSLTTAPELPATTLDSACYQLMFYGCSSLTTAPVLSATTLAIMCYDGMFWNCSSLATAPALPATTLANYCYEGMFAGCTSLTTAPELPATALTEGCYEGMFESCTSLTTAPVLSATTLADNCYWAIFFGCTSINYIKCLATDISATRCTYAWTYNVASSGTFVKASSMSDWTTGDDGIPNGWTVQNA